MKQLKKTLLTLVALLAVTTGAWADETLLLTIESTDYTSFTSGSKTFDDKVTVTFSNQVSNSGNDAGWYTWESSLLTVAGTNGYTITSCKFYTEGGVATTGYTIEGESPSVYLYDGYVYTDANYSVKIGALGVMKIEVYGAAASSASAVTVAWDGETKTGTFTMPGGNVTLEPEYYPQATVADGGVTAADADARATTDDPLVKVDATKLTGAKKLMYFVSNSGTTAPAYDAEGWTDQLPTAEGFTQQGIVYVWYYPVGIDEGVDGATATYSDGDICLQSITARVAAAPTYAVTFADDTAEPTLWKAEPAAGVTKGQTVTVTYIGSKKVIGVKAEKKAAAPASTPLDNTTTAWTAGTYAVPAGGLTYSDAITVSGDVTLVLTDGETLTLNKGISLASGATLTVEGNGTMNINGTNNSTASTVAGTGMLVLTSGTLNAKGGDGQSITAFGMPTVDNNTGASGGVAINGNVTVSGGTVTATGGNGGNLNTWVPDEFTENNHGGNGGAAISGSVTVNAGGWTATNGSNGTYTANADDERCSAGTGGKAVAGTVTDNR